MKYTGLRKERCIVKNRHYKYWSLTLIVIIVASVFLYSQRKRALDYESLLTNAEYDLRNPVSTVEMIIGEVNDYDKFNDYYIEDYNDLCKCSQEILLVKVNENEAIGNSIYAHCTIEKVVKSSNELDENDEITIAQMLEVRANVTENNKYHIDENETVRLLMYSPIIDMKKDGEYIVFLNKVEGIDDLYRQSSSLYGIVPLKSKISILLMEVNDDDFTVPLSKKYDYIAKINETFDIVNISDKSKIDTAVSLAENYWERYEKICSNALQQFDTEVSFEVID